MTGHADVQHRFIQTNGIRMHLVEAGGGPLVALLHGFPESWYSWRHQLTSLATAGYRVVAPDQRGYGQTNRPAAIESYSMFHLVGDVVGLLDVLGEGCGHWTQQERPAEVNQLLSDLLRSL
jgi:pimeloyl-ACP methyl ester carboxylesterase